MFNKLKSTFFSPKTFVLDIPLIGCVKGIFIAVTALAIGLSMTFFLISKPAAADPACLTSPLAMVSWWPGDGNANDIKDGNHGTLQGGAGFAPGVVGDAFNFDGIDDRVEVANSANLQFGTGEITIDAWIKAPSGNTIRNIVGKVEMSGRYPGIILRILDTGKLQFFAADCLASTCGFTPAQTVISPNRVDDNLNHHVAGVRTASGEFRLFVDGVLVAANNPFKEVRNSDNTAKLFIGTLSGTSSPFKGIVDEVGIYNRALTSTEIQSIFGSGSQGKCKVPDTTPPVVQSVNRVHLSPTSATRVSWAVTFSESVTNVDAADLELAAGEDITGAVITSVILSNPRIYTVTASTGSGSGALGLNLVDDDSIADEAGNKLGGAGAGNGNFTGEVYTVTAACTAPSSMVSWWPGDGNANDIKDGNHGTLQGGAGFAPGVIGDAFNFDGIDDRVQVANSANLQFGIGEITIDAWIRAPLYNTYRDIVGKQATGGNMGGIAFRIMDTGKLQFFAGECGASTCGFTPAQTAISPNRVDDNLIHHVAGVRTASGEFRLFVDGVLVAVRNPGFTDAQKNVNNTASLFIGAQGLVSGFLFPFKGLVDEVGIYNGALTSTEIKSIFESGSRGKCTVLADTVAPAVGAVTPATAEINTATTFSVTYSDSAGVTSCTFFADGVDQGPMTLVGTTSGAASKSYTYTSLGARTAQVKCKDAAGNEGTGALTTVTVIDVTAPIITSAALTPSIVGTTATISITKTVTDNVGVAGVSATIRGPSPSTAAIGTIPLLLTSGAAQNGTWTGSFVFPAMEAAPDGAYIVDDTVVDTSSNTVVGTDGIVILDRTAPLITVVAITPSSQRMGQDVLVTASALDVTSGISLLTARDVTSGESAVTMTQIGGSLAPGQASEWQRTFPAAAPEGPHTIEVASYDNAAPANVSTATGSYLYDTTPPVVKIVDPVDGAVTNQTVISVAWTVDGVLQTSTEILANEGPNTITRSAIDAAGNIGMDLITVTRDTVPPDTVITPPTPADPTFLTSATFTFNTTEDGLVFECKLDAGAFDACSSPKTYVGLAAGTHTFQVRAIDSAGNVDPTPAAYTWMVSTLSPLTVIGGSLQSCVTNSDGSMMICTILGSKYERTYVVTFPASTAPLSPNTTIVVTIRDANLKKPGMKIEAQLPAGQTKTLSLPRGSGSYACVDDVPGGDFQIGPGCPLTQRVNIPAPGSTVFYTQGKTIATNAANTEVTFTGLFNTVVTAGSDEDGDGIDDEADACPAIVGNLDWQGCPSAVRAVFQRHTVQTGTQPGSAKAPVIGASVSIFSKVAGSCAATIGVSPKNYQTIYTTCAPANSNLTDINGIAVVGVPSGDYIMISQDPVTLVYAGVAVGEVADAQLVDKFIQVIVRADGSSVPAKTTSKTGSVLYIIEPEYIEWSNTTELYPFVFDSEGDWEATVAVYPPEGFVVDYPSLLTTVNSDYKALQFTLTDIGSCWECGTDVEVTVKHKGKTEKWRSKIGTAMTEEFAGKKGLNSHELEKNGVVITKKGRVPKRVPIFAPVGFK